MALSLARTFVYTAYGAACSAANAAYSAANSAYQALPSCEGLRGKVSQLFQNTSMFLGANALLKLKGHPFLFITGYFTGIVLDKAVQEKFEKIQRVALSALLFICTMRLCLGKASDPYLIHTATFILAAKIGSSSSLTYNKMGANNERKAPLSNFSTTPIILGGAAIWLLQSHALFPIVGFCLGHLFEGQTEIFFKKFGGIAFANPGLILAHIWFIGASLPHALHFTSFLIAAKVGSYLSHQANRGHLPPALPGVPY